MGAGTDGSWTYTFFDRLLGKQKPAVTRNRFSTVSDRYARAVFEDGRPSGYAEQVTELAAALRLSYDPSDQDWGIEHSDAGRLEEFVEFARNEFSVGWHPGVVRELVDLLLDSAEEALRKDPSLELTSLREWLTANVSQIEVALAYWLGLDPADWPVVARLKTWGLRIVFAP
jgi:hypothetical protein